MSRGARVADALHVPLRAFTVGVDDAVDLRDSSGAWAKLYGVSQNGAVLVRPDGHVAWRSDSRVAAPETVLLSAFSGILGRATLS